MNTNPSTRQKRRWSANELHSNGPNDNQQRPTTSGGGSLAAGVSALPSYNPITGHPCNPYIRKPPNFFKLAQQSAELKPFLVSINNGQQHTIDFSQPEATVALTKAILKSDWDLKVDIPSDTLCPTVTNRLNYLLELRDLLHFCGHAGPAHLLDIGTGFTCIYPLIGCRLEPAWRFTGTDIDAIALQTAQSNVTRNNLSSRISLHHIADPTACFFPPPPSSPSVALPVTATLCNPPFYESETERIAHRDTKSTAHVTCPGTPEQMTTEGGEVAFVTRMVQESSVVYGAMPDADRPAVFTSMLGIKRSVEEVIAAIESLQVPWYTVRTLKQGVTSRWMVAWSFKALVVDRLTRFLTVGGVISVGGLVKALEAVEVPVVRLSKTAVDVELVLATWTRRWKRRKVFGGGTAADKSASSEATSTSADTVAVAHIPSGDGVTGKRAEPIRARMWWANKDMAQPGGSEPSAVPTSEEDESRSTEQPTPILVRGSARKETAVWIAGPKSDPLMHSFVMFITPLLDKL